MWTPALDEAHARRYDREASDRMEHLPVLCAGAICGAWITNPLEHDGSITFTTDEWQVLCNFRLGLPLPSGTIFFGGCPPHRSHSGTTPSPARRVGCTPVTTASGTPWQPRSIEPES